MLLDQIAKKRAEGVAPFLFREDLSNIARNRIRPPGEDFPVNPVELMLGQADRDLRPGHTIIIPLVGRRNKTSSRQPHRHRARISVISSCWFPGLSAHTSSAIESTAVWHG